MENDMKKDNIKLPVIGGKNQEIQMLSDQKIQVSRYGKDISFWDMNQFYNFKYCSENIITFYMKYLYEWKKFKNRSLYQEIVLLGNSFLNQILKLKNSYDDE